MEPDTIVLSTTPEAFRTIVMPGKRWYPLSQPNPTLANILAERKVRRRRLHFAALYISAPESAICYRARISSIDGQEFRFAAIVEIKPVPLKNRGTLQYPKLKLLQFPLIHHTQLDDARSMVDLMTIGEVSAERRAEAQARARLAMKRALAEVVEAKSLAAAKAIAQATLDRLIKTHRQDRQGWLDGLEDAPAPADGAKR
jgi:hypothetical protein